MRAAALVLLALAVVWPRWRSVQLLTAVSAGALLVGSVWEITFEGRHIEWAIPATIAVVAGVWWAAPRMHRELPLGVGWAVLCGSAAAVYLCVPETDQMREVGVVVAGGALAELLMRRRLPTPALAAAAGFVTWAALFGAVGRPSAVVGGLFAIVPPIAVAASSTSAGRTRLPTRTCRAAIAVVWVVAGLAMARTGGVADSLTRSLVAAAVIGGAAGILSLGLRGGRAAQG